MIRNENTYVSPAVDSDRTVKIRVPFIWYHMPCVPKIAVNTVPFGDVSERPPVGVELPSNPEMLILEDCCTVRAEYVDIVTVMTLVDDADAVLWPMLLVENPATSRGAPLPIAFCINSRRNIIRSVEFEQLQSSEISIAVAPTGLYAAIPMFGDSCPVCGFVRLN
jgi:hypothetical protein